VFCGNLVETESTAILALSIELLDFLITCAWVGTVAKISEHPTIIRSVFLRASGIPASFWW
jgi:hypothetical protein